MVQQWAIRNMETAIFRRIVVLLDQLAPDQGAFAHALDWARRLRLPLAGIPLATGQAGKPSRGQAGQILAPAMVRANGGEGLWVHGCANACARSSVAWQVLYRNGHRAFEVPQFLGPDDLLVLGRALPPAQKRAILRQTLQHATPGVLLCPDDWVPAARMLLLNQTNHSQEGFLWSAAELCCRLELKPVVLTVARSEHQARLQQQTARDALAGHSLSFDFDFVVGSEVRVAVAGVARWRRCQAVVMDRDNAASWWRWLWSSTFERLIGLPDPLAFLSLFSAVAPVSPRKPLSTTPASTDTASGGPASMRESLSAGTMGVDPARLPGP